MFLDTKITLAISLSFTLNDCFPIITTPQETGGCSNEGQYNCISGSTWQRCASGQWSVPMPVAAGTTCSATFIAPASAAPLASASPTPSPSPSPTPALAPTLTPVPVPVPSPGVSQSYSGPASNFPTASAWESFEDIWNVNLAALQYNDDTADIASMQSAIQTVAGMTNGLIDPRVIFAVIMQESSGNVHVISTNNGVENNGIMQSHDGVSYDPNNPAGSILQMVKDGTLGTNSGDGLEQTVQKFGGLWQGIRAYNSGSVDSTNLSNGLGSTNSYCSDIANRLMGAKSG